MRLTGRGLRAAIVVLAALGAAAPAHAATTVDSDATVWFAPAAPGDNAVRLTVHVADDADPAAAPGATERIITRLPAGLALQGGAFPAGAQLGSGVVRALVGPAAAPIAFDAYVIRGSTPGALVFDLRQIGGGVEVRVDARVEPHDDPGFPSTLVVPIPPELQQPVSGIYLAITEFDVLLHANAAVPYVAVTACPLDLVTTLDFDDASPNAPPAALTTTATSACDRRPAAAGEAAAAVRPAAVRPAAVGPAAAGPPPPTAIPAPEQSVAPFGVSPVRKRGTVRRLRLRGVPASARVSVRCLRRCGRRGADLVAARRGATVRLERRLRPRARFELRVARTGLVAGSPATASAAGRARSAGSRRAAWARAARRAPARRQWTSDGIRRAPVISNTQKSSPMTGTDTL